MNVVIKIAGRDAVPVRAIPFLTDWDRWSPDVLAAVFAGEAVGRGSAAGGAVATFRVAEGQILPIQTRWWENFVLEQLAALDQRLNETRGNTPRGRDEWKLQALGLLPAEAYVWLDEFTSFHLRDWRMRARVFAASAGQFPDLVHRIQVLGWGTPGDVDVEERQEETLQEQPLDPEFARSLRADFELLVRMHQLDLVPLIPSEFRVYIEEALGVASPDGPGAGLESEYPNWPKPPIHPIPDEIKDRILAALLAGQNLTELERATGYSRTTIRNIRDKASSNPFHNLRKKR